MHHPLSLVVAGFLAKRSYGYFQSQSTVRGKQTALVNEMIEGQKVVQAFGHEAESLAAFDEVNGQLQDVSLKAIFFSSLTNPATRFVNNIVYAGVACGCAVRRARRHHHRSAERFSELRQPVHQTLQRDLRRGHRVTECTGLRRPVFELLDAEDQVPEAETPPHCSRTAMCSYRMFPSAICPTVRSSKGSRWTCSPASASHRRPYRLRQDHPHQPAYAVL